MAPNRWNRNNWDRAGSTPRDIDRGTSALSFLNSVSPKYRALECLYVRNAKVFLLKVMLVFSYLNDQVINRHLADSTNDMLVELETFSDRYNDIFSAEIDLGRLHRDFLRHVLLPRLHRGVSWVQERLSELQRVWIIERNANPNNRQIRNLIDLINSRQLEVRDLGLRTSDLPDSPT